MSEDQMVLPFTQAWKNLAVTCWAYALYSHESKSDSNAAAKKYLLLINVVVPLCSPPFWHKSFQSYSFSCTIINQNLHIFVF